MHRAVMIDGHLVPPERAMVSVFDRGFLYGDSVFETIRTYGGRPFLLREHLRRLERSAALVLIDLPVGLDVLSDEVEHTVDAGGYAESYIRVMVTRGTGGLGLDPSSSHSPCRVILVAPLEPPGAEAYDRGIAAVTYETQRVAEATDAVGAKVGNYLVAALAMRRARQAGASEALIVDGRGTVVEGATSNVFCVDKGRLVTAPEEAGILPGITRALLLEAAAALPVEVELRAPTVAELFRAEEVLISSSIRELLPVTTLDGRPIGGGAPGPVTRALHAAFRRKVHDIMAS